MSSVIRSGVALAVVLQAAALGSGCSDGAPSGGSGAEGSVAQGAGGGPSPLGAGGIDGSGSASSGGVAASGGTHASAAGGSPTGGGGAGGSGGSWDDGCPESGSISYQLNAPESWPSDVVTRITEAMDEAVATYNCYASLEKSITVNYNPGVPTAEANVDGWLSFGSNQAYMQTATAMHEIAHTLGVGYSPWSELMDDGRWIGPAVAEFMQNLPAEERDADSYSQRTYITGDAQHFWPYGLNQASEHQSEFSLINHVRIVACMQLDKRAYLDGDLD